MPIYQQKNVSETIQVGIWKIAETEQELTNQLINKGITSNNKPQTLSKSRITQWLATRLLLQTFLTDVAILYDDLGKPSLSNGWFISISHSHEFVAIVINQTAPCGIDIEKISEKVGRIKHKYLNSKDLINISTLEQLTLYWGAKEALYKLYGKKEVLFIENLFLENVDQSLNTLNGRIEMPEFKKVLPMTWEIIEEFVLVYTL